ncbi:MAG TPA: cbb3-type cytochrome oxidase assembly protein CcoS [Hanamia sp.]|nr:cbb3-type cytochrome oxidase assembly protein CcoS [Hanamia sp.]
MSVMLVLLGASLIVALIFLTAFIWSVKNGQYDDDVSPAHKILFEDKPTNNQLNNPS